MSKSQSQVVKLGWNLTIGDKPIQLFTENILGISDAHAENSLNKVIERNVSFKMSPGTIKLTLGQIADWIKSLDDKDTPSFDWPNLIYKTLKKNINESAIPKIEVDFSDLSITPKGFISFNILIKDEINKALISSPSLLPQIKNLIQDGSLGFGITYQVPSKNIVIKLVSHNNQEKNKNE